MPYCGAGITAQMEGFNNSMSSVRTSVEWLFGDIINYFKFVDFKKTQKISLSAVGKMYIVRNFKECHCLVCMAITLQNSLILIHLSFKIILHNNLNKFYLKLNGLRKEINMKSTRCNNLYLLPVNKLNWYLFLFSYSV